MGSKTVLIPWATPLLANMSGWTIVALFAIYLLPTSVKVKSSGLAVGHKVLHSLRAGRSFSRYLPGVMA